MTPDHVLAQLRHLYSLMLAGNVKDCEQAAHGLLGPAIEGLEIARRVEQEQAETIKALAEYIRTRTGHEENCRGWRRPVKDKTAPAWKRRGEWTDIAACTCGPGASLRRAGRLP